MTLFLSQEEHLALLNKLRDDGVLIEAPWMVHVDPKVKIGRGTVLRAGAQIRGESTIGEDCDIAGIIADSQIGNACHIGPGAEIRESVLGNEVRARHQCVILDAEVGDQTNIGAGVVTADFNGERHHHTIIGRRAFIGSLSSLVDGGRIGDEAFIATQTRVDKPVPNNAEARTEQGRLVINPNRVIQVAEIQEPRPGNPNYTTRRWIRVSNGSDS